VELKEIELLGTLSHLLIWQSAAKLARNYELESSETIENLFTEAELVEYRQVPGSGFLGIPR